MFGRWFPRSSVTLAFVSIGVFAFSCAGDTPIGSCTDTCTHAWSICEADLKSDGVVESSFHDSCVSTCQSAAASNARDLGQSLNCASQATDCDSARQCSVFGPMLGFTNSGGFAGFSGFGGQPNFGCTDQTVQACTCPSGTNGVEQCSNGNWGPCRCSSAFGSGGASGCTDDCFYSFNGVCDDGAAGSSTARCAYGTDCSDCGIRTLGAGGFGGGFGSTGGFRGTGGHVVDAGRGPRDASADVSSGRVDASTDAAPDAPFVPAD